MTEPAATRQTPLGSPFDSRSTVAEVLAGIDLHGRVAIVTGGSSGLGAATTAALAAAGATVVVPARRPEAARAALHGLGDVEVAALDLADLASVRAFADAFLDGGRPLDLLIASAGVMACPERRVGPGWEAQLAVNHLGHFTLVNRLRAAFAPGARVVAVSSAGHRRTGIRWDDPQLARGYDKWIAYGQSKTANALFAVELDARGRTHGVRAFAANPGVVLTPLQRHLTRAEQIAAGVLDEHGEPVTARLKTPEQGAATLVWAATSPLLRERGGLYCEDCDVAALAESGDTASGGVHAHAIDPGEARRLWELSAELTGVDGF